MNLSRFSIERPVTTVMACLMVVLVGAVSLSRLAIDLMPDITYPTLSISTTYENASPEEIEELITRPIEEAMSAVPGVEEITSVSAEGQSSVRVSLTWGTDLDAATNDVRDRLDRVVAVLPDAADRPWLRKFDLASFPILIAGVSSELNPLQVRELIDNRIKHRIERIPGVASIDIRGGLEREIHVDLDGEKLKALELSLDEIISSIRDQNVTLPAGVIERDSLNVTLRTPGVYTSLDELRGTVAAFRDGVPIRLENVAAVVDSWERVTRIVRVNAKPGIRFSVSKQSGKNTVEVAEGVLREIDRINEEFSQINITPIIDTSDYIKRSITNLGTTVLYGGVLAVLVLFFFLRSIPGTAVIATTIPISVIATFSLMYFSGSTLNLMTLGGLALGIGMLVDNAIVVLENIYRIKESGKDSRTAALQGSHEVVGAVIASTLTTLVVFLPLIFVRGMAGIMFKQLAYVVAFSLACSLLVALTLVPMLASRALGAQGPAASPGGKTDNGHGSRKMFARLEESYGVLLHRALGRPYLTVITAFAVLGGSFLLVPLVGVELMPVTDESEVRVYAEMAMGTRVEVLEEVFKKIEDVVAREVPEVQNNISFLGGTTWRAFGSNAGEMRISLKPVRERTRSSEEIADALRGKLMDIPGTVIRTRAGQGLFILRMADGEERVQVEIRGHDLETAQVLAHEVKDMVEGVEGVTDATISMKTGTPEALVVVDRQKAADMRLSVSKIAGALQWVLSGASAGDYREGGNEYNIRVRLQDAEKRELRDILDLPVINMEGHPVVLRNVVEVRPHEGPVIIERKDQERVVYVSANISGRDMGSILADVRNGIGNLAIPGDFSVILGGDYEEQQKAFRELLVSLVLALLLVYMVMASLYESLRHPLVVMFSVPPAGTGVILALLLTGTTFNIQSYIGCIMLGGIVVNNAILLVDHINLLRRRDGFPVKEAIEEAGRRRLRPILTTAATTMLAMMPLALGLGEGGEAQAPMARAIIGGLMSATLITLVVVPIVYAIMERKTLKR